MSYTQSHFQISFTVAFFPYIKIPVLKIFPASFINSQTLKSKITIDMIISIQGHFSSIDNLMINMPGEVKGIYELILATRPFGSVMIGPRSIKGKNGNINTNPWKLPEVETSSIVAPIPTKIDANNKYPRIAMSNKTANSGTNRYLKIGKSNFQMIRGMAIPSQTTTWIIPKMK